MLGEIGCLSEVPTLTTEKGKEPVFNDQLDPTFMVILITPLETNLTLIASKKKRRNNDKLEQKIEILLSCVPSLVKGAKKILGQENSHFLMNALES